MGTEVANRLTPEQQRSLSLARARAKLAQSTAEKPAAPTASKPISDAVSTAFGKDRDALLRARQQSFLASAPGRFLAGVAAPVQGGVQLLAHGASQLESMLPSWAQTGLATRAAAGSDEALARQAAEVNEAKRATGFTGPDIAGLAGNIASPINYVLPALKFARPALGVAAPLGKRAASGAIIGGGLGSLQPVTDTDTPYAEQKAFQTGLGVLGGAAAPAVGAALGKVFSPTVSADVRSLLDRGIRLTPGQILGGSWRALEDKLASYPVAGSFISGAQARSVDDFNRVLSNEVLKPIGSALPKIVKTGRDAVAYAGKQISDVYNTVLPKMTGELDAPLMMKFKDVIDRAKSLGASDDALNRLNRIIEGQFTKRSSTSSGYFDGSTLKLIQSDLSDLGRKFSSSDNADDQLVGDAVHEMTDAFNDMLLQKNPQFADILSGANAAWAKFSRLRAAAGRVGAKGGNVTPAQFAGAVRAGDASVQKGAYARGSALMQDLSDAALDVLPSKYPDSGTAGRLGLLGLLGAAGAVPALTGPAAIIAGGLSGLYTRPGQAVARGLLTHKPLPQLSDFSVRLGNAASAPSASSLASTAGSGYDPNLSPTDPRQGDPMITVGGP